MYGWGKRRRPHEDAILQAIQAAMPEADQRTLAEQLKAVDLVQRSAGGRMVVMFLDPEWEAPALFANRDAEQCLARVRLASGRHRNTALLMSSRGRISSLEFKRSPEPLRKAAYDILDITLNVVEQSIARAIDRHEHGRVGDDES
jgi:hypothetical protein